MAQFNAESPVADWLRHNVSFVACFFSLFFFFVPLLHPSSVSSCFPVRDGA